MTTGHDADDTGGNARTLEIWSHAIIGGLLAVALASFDALLHAFSAWFPENRVVAGGLFLCLLFLAVMFAIHRLATYLDRRQRRLEALLHQRPIHVGDVGLADGYWIDAIWDLNTRLLIECSVIRIESAVGEGFSVSGSSFDAADIDDQKGYFSGKGYLWGNGFIYYYDGYGGVGEHDRGIGHYTFHRDPTDAENIRFDGSFMAFGLKSTRYVRGRKIRNSERARFEQDNGKSTLRAFLAEAETRLNGASPPPARPARPPPAPLFRAPRR